MTNSHLLALIILALSVLCAWAVRHFGRKYGQPPRKIRWLTIGFLVGGVVFAAYAYWIDSALRETTLYEAVLEGPEGATERVVREVRFTIEHAGVEHELLVEPKPAMTEEAARPIELGVRLAYAAAATAWVDERVQFGIHTESGRGSMALASRDVWESRSFRFVPERIGDVELKLSIDVAGLHAIHVRVEDPLKTDGKRAAGY